MIEEKEHQWHDGFPDLRGMTVLPWLGWALILIFIIGALYAGKVFAEPIAQATVNEGAVVVTVFSEDCNLKATVANLPKRATWVEKGKTFEGCVGVEPAAGVAIFYVATDKSVTAIPLVAFARVTGV